MDKEDVILFGAIVKVSGLSDYEWVDLIKTAKEELDKERCLEKGIEILKKATVLGNGKWYYEFKKLGGERI